MTKLWFNLLCRDIEAQLRFSQALQHNVEHVTTALSRADWRARRNDLCA